LTTEAEAVDRVSLGLPGVQSELVRAVVAANPNVVFVMLNGGPLAIEWEKEHVPAIVESFFPGEMGGDAIVSVLYGDVAPTGRLSVTVCATFPFFPLHISCSRCSSALHKHQREIQTVFTCATRTCWYIVQIIL